ncbi:family 20 glycosylhydrolase [Actinomyces weissii]|uniref:Family 20 glycosylhydrolase n=1 Tax=Actinomyces weissii TaxID=675090 RepID=A0A7T7MAQ4_9ACTO|nr:family 20 glycosylhydrolase [Actinomyces weissii]QQM68021.1 family 20 glycosylhydrolase [Actinomyces weissii]
MPLHEPKTVSRRLLGVALAAALTALGTTALPAARAQADSALAGEGLSGVVPAVTSFTPQEADPFRLSASTRLVIPDPADEAALTDEASLLAAELENLSAAKGLELRSTPAVVVGQAAAAGDITLRLEEQVAGVSTAEGYRLEATSQGVTITATGDAGAFYGTRTLLQSITSSGGLQAGQVVDQPAMPVRSLHLDAARKYFTKDWIINQVREMSWVKLNQLQYHFSENEGFRLESKTHPEIMSSQYITQAELAEIIAEGAKYHVEIVPALDMPGHMAALLESHPELRVGSSASGRKILDYSKPEARQLAHELIDEYTALFPSNSWHLGGDEVFPIDGNSYYSSLHSKLARQYPQLHTYAKEHAAAGQSATVLDGYVHFLNETADYIQSKGKTQVRAWNDALSYTGTTEKLAADVDIAYWTGWHGAFPTVQKMVDEGHRLINFNDAYFYYVLTYPGWAYSTKPTAEKIYGWHPGVYPGHQSGITQTWEGQQPAWNLGASFAIWCDKPHVETEEQVAAGVKPLLRAMASRVWNPADTTSFSTWNTRQQAVGETPGNLPPLPRTTAQLDFRSAPESGTQVSRGQVLSRTVTLSSDATAEVNAQVTADLSGLGRNVTVTGAPQASYVDASGHVVPSQAGRNVALGRPVTASGQEGGTVWSKEKVVDGLSTADSRWSSDYSDQAWIAVELAEPTAVDHVDIVWEAACAPSFEIMTSTDGEHWTSGTGVLKQTCPPNKLSAEKRSYRLSSKEPVKYVKMQAHSRQAFGGDYYGVSLWELAVWDGPEQALSAPQPQLNEEGQITWDGPLPQGHGLRLTWEETISQDAAAGTSLEETVQASAGNSEPLSATSTHTVQASDAPEPPVTPSAEPTVGPSALPSAVPSAGPSAEPGGPVVPEGAKPAYVSAVEAKGNGKLLYGDWDGDGKDSWAVRVGSRVVFYADNRVDAPVYASISLGRSTDQVLVGDWDGDGYDTLALRRGTTVLTQKKLTSTSTERVVVEGITRTSPVKVVKGVEPGGRDVIVLG